MEQSDPAPGAPCCRCSCCSPAISDDPTVAVGALALAEVDGEREALRETVESHKQTIQELCDELDEERNAASTAANEAIAMILRLQHEKAEAQMESRQFRRLAEERFEHDQQEIEELEEELSRREEAIEALSSEVQELRERLAAGPLAADEGKVGDCRSEETPLSSASSGHVPTDPEILGDDIEVLEKEVVQGGCPREEKMEQEEIPVPAEFSLGDDSSDRVYTIDAVHGTPSDAADSESEVRRNAGPAEVDLRDLQRRVQTLEEDREAAQRAIVNIKAEEMQVVMLREISRNLLKVLAQQTTAMLRQRQVVRKQRSWPEGFSFLGLLKWLVSFLFFWRRKPNTTQPALTDRNTGGSSSNKICFSLILQKSQLFQQLRSLSGA